MQEVWKDVVGYEGLYEVSNMGRVKSLARVAKNRYGVRPIRERVLKPALDTGGYPRVGLFKNSKPRYLTVHKLVAEAFIPNPDGKPCVDHINSIRDDNRVENLTWATYSENNLRGIHRLGPNSKKGEDNKLSVLKEVQVIEICKMLDEGVLLQKQIAVMYEIAKSNISNINTGTTWNWLTGRKSRLGGSQ